MVCGYSSKRDSPRCAALTTKQSLRKPADNHWFSFCGGLTGHATDAKLELTNWLIILRVTANVRLIIELNATEDTVKICEEIEVEGVGDYHGDKNTWDIS